MARGRFKMATRPAILVLLIVLRFIAFADCAKSKSMFKFTKSLYVATMPENARGRVYAVPVEGKTMDPGFWREGSR